MINPAIDRAIDSLARHEEERLENWEQEEGPNYGTALNELGIPHEDFQNFVHGMIEGLMDEGGETLYMILAKAIVRGIEFGVAYERECERGPRE